MQPIINLVFPQGEERETKEEKDENKTEEKKSRKWLSRLVWLGTIAYVGVEAYRWFKKKYPEWFDVNTLIDESEDEFEEAPTGKSKQNRGAKGKGLKPIGDKNDKGGEETPKET